MWCSSFSNNDYHVVVKLIVYPWRVLEYLEPFSSLVIEEKSPPLDSGIRI